MFIIFLCSITGHWNFCCCSTPQKKQQSGSSHQYTPSGAKLYRNIIVCWNVFLFCMKSFETIEHCSLYTLKLNFSAYNVPYIHLSCIFWLRIYCNNYFFSHSFLDVGLVTDHLLTRRVSTNTNLCNLGRSRMWNIGLKVSILISWSVMIYKQVLHNDLYLFSLLMNVMFIRSLSHNSI